MFATLLVLKLDTSSFVRLEQAWNIVSILVTLLVSKLCKSKVVRLEQ